MKVITIKLYNRPAYTSQVLTALNQCVGIDDYEVLLFIEPGDNQVIKIAQDAAFRKRQIVINERKLGITANTFQAIEAGFELGDFVIHLEDDTVPAKDFLLFMEHCRREYRSNPFIFSVCGYQYSNPNLPQSLYHAVEKRLSFNPWGWGTWKDRWKEVKARWKEVTIPNAFSQFLKNIIRKERYEIMPLLGRVQNIGSEGGCNTSPQGHLRFHYNRIWAGSFQIWPGEFWEKSVDTRICYALSFREKPSSVWKFQDFSNSDDGSLLYVLRSELIPNITLIKQGESLMVRIDHYFQGTFFASKKFCCSPSTTIQITDRDFLIDGDSIWHYLKMLKGNYVSYLLDHSHYVTNYNHNDFQSRAVVSFLRPHVN